MDIDYRPGTVVDVSSWLSSDTSDEAMGARDKLWIDHDPDQDQPRWLFKNPREPGRLAYFGADLVSEVLAHHLASLVKVPTVEVAFARTRQNRGVIVRRTSGDLLPGNVLLPGVVAHYDRIDTRADQYNLPNISRALTGIAGCEVGLTAFESFVGFLCLDALIANTDRHHENWAVSEISGLRSLAPSYDHGSSLGFNAPEGSIEDLSRFAHRGRSNPFETNLVDLAQKGLEMVSAEVAVLWRSRFEGLARQGVESLVADVPSDWMPAQWRGFVVELVTMNQERLLR